MTDMNALLDQMQGKRVMIIGDLMLDHYTFGQVSRISPEAPVPVVEVIREEYVLGGAGNVALNINAMGGQALLAGVIGTDRDGESLNALLRESAVETRLVHADRRRTTRKTRIIANNQQIVRVDREDADPLTESVVGELLEILREHSQDIDIIIVSDYGKGVVTAPLMDALRSLKGAHGRRPRILVDPKPQNYDLYQGVDILTPNAKEAGEGAAMPCSWPLGPATVGQALFRRLDCQHLLITLGPQGMALFESRNSARHIPTFARTVFDVTGAGDTVIATLALALAAGAPLVDAAVLANHAAGIVVGQVGAATPTVDGLRQAVQSRPAQPMATLPGMDETAFAARAVYGARSLG
ncbi:rfaE bifunctional protein, domain I [Humidesulfovibrio mexicanus]|uniref:RfaE bifunctional protein, domain I n=1 Tax=Humidesulfovibrio mexicanus TaxID=147047 RepID=A0A238ZTG4_9BACT|nr:D-glycero-beta-D-manno-heptose-7-phosphate kinase [Humidesulfovibrio mexicanus]SNR86726.1 rfaE bifunctional protein, domain I [Humidesulfovibrio mexicanus]